jgi:hypothetical protein
VRPIRKGEKRTSLVRSIAGVMHSVALSGRMGGQEEGSMAQRPQNNFLRGSGDRAMG